MPDAKIKHENIAAALAAFQADLPTISKGNTAQVASQKGSYSYKYADLAEISPLVLPKLGKQGLSWSTRPTVMGDDFVLHYCLAHESGETVEGTYPLPSPQTPPQQLGSAITYARRYALCAVTGVAPGGDDDDAASAPSAPARKQAARRPAAPPPAVAQRDWAAEIATAEVVEDLRAIHVEAETEGQLGLVLNPDHRASLEALVAKWDLEAPPDSVPVGGLIGAVKKAIESRPEPTPDAVSASEPAPTDSWDVAPIPGADEPAPSGDEPF